MTKEHRLRTSKGTLLWVLLPSAYLALSHIQLHMWFVHWWTDGQVYAQIAHNIFSSLFESITNIILIFWLAHLFLLFRKAPDEVYTIGDLMIIEPST